MTISFSTRGAIQAGPRARAAAWARAIVADPYAVFLDTETTGLGRDAEIVDIAVVAVDGRVLYETLVRPRGPIPADASRIHGIYAEHVADAPRWCEVHAGLATLLRGRRVVVYNAAYDEQMVRQCCDGDGLAHPFCEWLCAMHAYAEFAGEPNRQRGGFRWHKLERATAAFDLPPGGHRARGDADACRLVVRAMAEWS